MKICSKINCCEIGQIVRHNNKYEYSYCYKHYRIMRMRDGAKQKNKYMPSFKEIEDLIPKDMRCVSCNKNMVWHKRLGCLADVMSLQHNHDNSIVLICQGCNAGHSNSQLGDKYFDIPIGYKYCPSCKFILKIKKFYSCKTWSDNLSIVCKKCDKRKRSQRKRNQRARKNINKIKQKSQYHGISPLKNNKKYRARIYINETRISIGCFNTEEEATIAHDQFIIDNKLDVTKYKLNYPMDFYD